MSKQRSRTARHEVKQACRLMVSTCNGGKTVNAKKETDQTVIEKTERPRVTLSQIVARVLQKHAMA